jgi:alkanesulfonate monooxygenase SsuD/methylene tetrahydromethanopterin reductase-like flavin-dependent oxidoreductase (luciferase family)
MAIFSSRSGSRTLGNSVMLARSIIGSAGMVHSGINSLIQETGADELMIVSDVYDHAARLRSFELIASTAS